MDSIVILYMLVVFIFMIYGAAGNYVHKDEPRGWSLVAIFKKVLYLMAFVFWSVFSISGLIILCIFFPLFMINMVLSFFDTKISNYIPFLDYFGF